MHEPAPAQATALLDALRLQREHTPPPTYDLAPLAGLALVASVGVAFE